MDPRIDDLRERIRALESELEGEFARVRREWQYRVDRGRVRFEAGVQHAHKRFKQSIPRFIRESSPVNILTAPLIYSLLLPIALADLWITLYQRVCFPAYGIAIVPRSSYVVFDRHHLAYLNGIEKLNCLYCSYANGVFGYMREIGARTEQYWCPIRHAHRIRGAHAHYRQFVEYGDAEGYKRRLPMLREELRASRDKTSAP